MTAIVGVAEGLALAGEEDEALGLLPRLKTPGGREIPARIARVHASLNDRDRAFAWLERAFEERSRELIYLRVEPVWNKFRDDPRFDELVRRVGIPQTRDGGG